MQVLRCWAAGYAVQHPGDRILSCARNTRPCFCACRDVLYATCTAVVASRGIERPVRALAHAVDADPDESVSDFYLHVRMRRAAAKARSHLTPDRPTRLRPTRPWPTRRLPRSSTANMSSSQPRRARARRSSLARAARALPKQGCASRFRARWADTPRASFAGAAGRNRAGRAGRRPRRARPHTAGRCAAGRDRPARVGSDALRVDRRGPSGNTSAPRVTRARSAAGR